MKMNAWNWVFVAIAVVVLGALAAGAPDIARYLKMRRM
jgi:hypothetical protein